MRLHISDYSGKHQIVSLSLDDRTQNDLMEECVDQIRVCDDKIIAYPSADIISENLDLIAKLKEFNDYDVLEIYEDGSVYRRYDDSSSENIFFITEKCNSNCIMCPSPDASRRRGVNARIDELIDLASHIPSDVSHITITGGEPFMIGKSLFELLDFCKSKFENTDFLLLTNGRIFAVSDYCELLKNSIPNNMIIGIPLHGSIPDIHDSITRAPNSFLQTVTGVKNLQRIGINTEIRIVVCKPNLKDIPNIARLIIDELGMVNHVSIMAMEMTGNAHINSEAVWVPYRESFKYVREAADLLIASEIDVRLYNFPLCTVTPEYRTLCYKSISSWKVRYSEVCDECTIKDACGGAFAGTILKEENEFEAVK